MIIYHGSRNNFKEFDYSRIREHATSEGVGFYCTDKKNIAESYAGEDGYVMHFEFKGKKPLSSKGITLSKDKITKLLTELNKTNQYLSNFGDIDYEGYSVVLDRAIKSLFEYCEDDIELLSDICNSCGDFKEPMELMFNMFGYDHCIVDINGGCNDENQTMYILLTNRAIKYIKSERRGV